MVSTQLIADPKEAAEEEAIMAVMVAAEEVAEEVEEAKQAMSLMALLDISNPNQSFTVQEWEAFWAPTMDATLCCRCKSTQV